MTSRKDTAERLWLELTSGRQQASPDRSSELRQTNTARLRQARLNKEAEDKVRADRMTAKKIHQV
jgi:hypothetical protein